MRRFLFLLLSLLSASLLVAAPTTKNPKTISDLGIDFSKVEDAGNPEDPATHYGAVLESFKLAKYDITAEQYCALLNKVAKHADPYMLYDERMSNDPNVASIKRTGDANSGYTYAPKSAATAKLPIVYVNWFCAARYCNWMHNSTIAGHLLEGSEDATTTEKGAYDFTTPVQVMINKYVDFLNAIASTEDPNNLHKKLYQDEAGLLDRISCNKSDDNKYTYVAKQGQDATSTAADYVGVSWASAARFINWRYNTETTKNPHHYTQEEITEKGLFDIAAGMKDITGDGDKKVLDNGETAPVVYVIPTDYAKLSPDAKYYLASEDQWYKAGYFKRTKNAGLARFTGSNYSPEYWTYPTSSDKAPVNYLQTIDNRFSSLLDSGPATIQTMDSGNGANYYVEKDGSNNNNDNYPEFTTGDKTPHLTPIGYFSKTFSPYGIFDMAGNVSQWLGGTPAHNVTYPDGHVEWQYAGVTRPIRGGAWGKDGQCPVGPQQFAKDTSMVIDASVRRDYIGFRIASPL